MQLLRILPRLHHHTQRVSPLRHHSSFALVLRPPSTHIRPPQLPRRLVLDLLHRAIHSLFLLLHLLHHRLNRHSFREFSLLYSKLLNTDHRRREHRCEIAART